MQELTITQQQKAQVDQTACKDSKQQKATGHDGKHQQSLEHQKVAMYSSYI